jgi:hypothetical protein
MLVAVELLGAQQQGEVLVVVELPIVGGEEEEVLDAVGVEVLAMELQIVAMELQIVVLAMKYSSHACTLLTCMVLFTCKARIGSGMINRCRRRQWTQPPTPTSSRRKRGGRGATRCRGKNGR